KILQQKWRLQRKILAGLLFHARRFEEWFIHFLDYALPVKPKFFWPYAIKIRKPILQHQSFHLKAVKIGVVHSILPSVLQKSCVHAFLGTSMLGSFRHLLRMSV